MSRQFDTIENERKVSSTDDDVLNPEDIDMEDASHFSAHQTPRIYEINFRSQDSDNHDMEHDNSDSGIGGFDEEVLDELEQDLELYKYWEENGGVLDR